MVLAEIGGADLLCHERVFNVGIREQLMIGVAAGMTLEGMRSIAHSYAPLPRRARRRQMKLDLVHQHVGAVLVSIGASNDGCGVGPHASVARRRGAAGGAAGLEDPRAGRPQ